MKVTKLSKDFERVKKIKLQIIIFVYRFLNNIWKYWKALDKRKYNNKLRLKANIIKHVIYFTINNIIY